MAMRLYLDFDGVLHRTGRDVLPFEYLPAVEDILRQYSHVDVVISSSWRETFSPDYIRDMFFSDDVQPQIIGATPVLPDCLRVDEVLAHIRQTRYPGPFIVVDDDPSQFPVNWPPLLLCEASQGLNPVKQVELIHRIQHG